MYVVPLRVGGGTRLKIFEALAMGKAVVSTTVGAEGFHSSLGSISFELMIPRVSAAVVSLLRDPIRRKTLGIAGRRLVEEQYSWSSSGEFEAKCKKVLTRHGPA